MNRTILFFTTICLAILCSCGEKKPEALAKQHCSSCHAFPDPSLLNKKIWQKGVLPEMAFRMGLDYSKLHAINQSDYNEVLKSLPDGPMISAEDWEIILDHYIKNAPETLSVPDKIAIPRIQKFTGYLAVLPLTNPTMVTMLKYDPLSKSIWVGMRNAKLFQLSSSLVLEDSFQLESPASSVIFQKSGGALISCLGIMDPNDQAVGTIISLAHGKGNVTTLIDSIKRPVDISTADFNRDGQQDLAVSAFGNYTGNLSVFENDKGKYIQHVLHYLPGTRKTIVTDFNDDGLPDIIALITQGDEQIALFTNRGKFRFSYEVLLKFPPVYGSSYFGLYDFNHDGETDILYTNGDNADFSSILKPYHGVRIFLNDGKNQFKESWFYPMHGASMAHAVDFDQDGDLDIAAISFFPDFDKHPENSFVYLENQGETFIPFNTTLAGSARWITMESADIDNDQDTDIILGALNFPIGVPDSLMNEWRTEPSSLLVLKNNLR
jgi:hypothetical protein